MSAYGYQRIARADVPTPAVGEFYEFIDLTNDHKTRVDSSRTFIDLDDLASGGGSFAPLTHVGSTGVSQHGVATGADAGFMSPSDKTKLDAVASGATANDTDANLKNRANHTGTQLAGTISDFSAAADARATIVIGSLLSDVDNTSDVDKPVSTAQAAADAATLASANSYTDSSVAALVDSSPATLNTLQELAAALGDDENFAATTATAIGLKANKSGDTFTGEVVVEGDLNGTGTVNLKSQNTDPATPASGVRVFADTNERFSFKGQSGFKSTFNDHNQTEDRQYDLPDVDGPLMADPTTTDGDLITKIAGTISRLGIGGEDFILRSIGGLPSWEEENLMQDIGDGSDGSVTLTGLLTAPDNLYYTLLKPDAGGVLNPDAYIVYAKTLDLTSSGVNAITRNGNNGNNGFSTTAGASGGANFTARVLATNGAGGTGAVGQPNTGIQGAAGGTVAIGNGGNGGASGVSGAGGTGGGAAAISGGAVTTNMHFGRFEYQFVRGATQVGGGAGGRGGNTGGGDGANSSRGAGGGGAGGAVLVLICGEIITGPSTPSGVISAKGGNGGTNLNNPLSGNVGGSSGAGGGGGGYIYCAYAKKTGPVIANLFDASGGNGGNGGNALGTGIGGNGGAGGNGGKIQLFNITTGQGTLVVGTAGSLGSVGAGVSGGLGGAGGNCVASL